MTGSSNTGADSSCPNRSGTLLGSRYRLQRRIAVGGMGEVYAATHVDIPKRYAIKLLRPEFTRDTQMQARFRFEAETAARLASEHIVDIADFGIAQDGSPYLVMELLEGADLRRVLGRRGRLSVPDASELIAQACAGLVVAHRHGIVHRDLKPENLFLTQRGSRAVLKVLDFGIAKLRNQSLGTESGKLLGTPAYMPPEQIRSDWSVDERADVYALGAILYELLSGVLPHPGEGPHEIICHALFEPVVPLRECNQAVPEELARIVHRAVSASREQRFASAAEFAAALAPFAKAETLLPVEGADAPESPTPPARVSELSAADCSRAKPVVRTVTRTWRRVYIGGACALLAVGLLWYSVQRKVVPHVPATPVAQLRAPPATSSQPSVAPEPGPEALNLRTPPTSAAAVVSPPASSAVVISPPAAAVAPTEPPAKRASTRSKRGERPHAEPVGPAPVSIPPSTIEVQRGDRTIVFKRDNPLRSE